MEDYRAPCFSIDHVELDIELDPKLTRVQSKLSVSRNRSGTFELNGQGLDLVRVTLDGRELAPREFRYEKEILHILNVPEEFELEICNTVSPRSNPQEMGLFERRGIIASECEPYGFRRITFFPDRPDVLTTYTVTLTADRDHYPVLLSNGNRVAEGELDDGRWWVRWHDPIPKPSYIFALFAGRFGRLTDHYETASGRQVELNIYIEEELVDQCGHAMASLKRALLWDEETYGFEYDLDVYNIVALVGHGNAMENKGLNLFGAEGIVANKDTTSDVDFLVIERIIAHEVFHNWTGNRVTCRDWFQLCLKEGLTRFRDQTYDQSLAMGSIKRIWQVKMLRRNQFPDDDRPNAHAVRPRSYHTVENFYNSTVYDKGAEIVRMLHGLLGNEQFHQGVRLFIDRHDMQAATLEDFLTAMAEVSGRDLRQFSDWYDIAGRARIEVDHFYDTVSRELKLSFIQRPPKEGAGALVIPVRLGLVSTDGSSQSFSVGSKEAEPRHEAVVEITRLSQNIVLHNVESKSIPSLLRGFSAPVSLEHSLDRNQLGTLATKDSDPYVRWDSMQRLYVSVIREIAGQIAEGRIPVCDDIIPDCVQTNLSKANEDKGLVAELVEVPDEPNLSEGLARIDLDGLMAGRKMVMDILARQLGGELMDNYLTNHKVGHWSLSESSISGRMLKNACLVLMAGQGNREVIKLCFRQLTESDCMTDRFAALNCLVNLKCPERDEALDWAYHQWKSNPLLMKYWFTAQALGRTDDVITRIKSLMEHPAYDPGNTIHAMALLGSFFRQNRVAFHNPSGEAYSWLAEILLFVDKIRPGGTGWLMPQINQWRRYDDHRRQLMRTALESVAGTEDISLALYENVN